jgi:sugar transferase (PEP-CTERM/EpsH1 system associated)
LSEHSARPPPLVVHVIYALGTGGLENGLVNIINRCPPGRYRHAIICLTQADAFAGRIKVPEVEIIELHKRPGHDPALYWRLWRALRRLRPALVHSRNLAALETQLLGLLMPGVKRVHGEHGRDVHDLDGSNPKYRWMRRLLQPLIHRFIAVSRDLENWLVKQVGIPSRKVTHIYNGVDHARFVSGAGSGSGTAASLLPEAFLPPSGALVLGTVGRLAAVKDQALIIRALSVMLDAQPALRERLRCIMVGDGPMRGALEVAIAEAGLGDVVWLTGDRDDVPALIGCMDLFLLPSLGEGISNTILEAMASGLPVIATDVGGNPELVEQGITGMLFPVGDANALADAILRLDAQPELRARMGKAARARARADFDWGKAVDAYVQVYDDLLDVAR